MRSAVVAYLAALSPALATSAPLTSLPAAPSLTSCQAWASAQDDDARGMWGQLETGSGSEEVGVLRLTLYCLGDPKPAIASFGSSAGYDQSFCAKRPKAVICRPYR